MYIETCSKHFVSEFDMQCI